MSTLKDLAAAEHDVRVWHPLTLPSKGRFYKAADGSDLCPDGDIQFALWTTAHEEILVRYGAADGFVDRMLQGNIRLPAGMKYEDLLVADQFFILMRLRADSLCPFFTYKCQCRQCKKEFDVQANLRELSILDLNEVGDEPLPCYLPHANVELTLRFPRVKDTKAIEKLEKEREDKLGEEGILHYQYARQIQTIDGQSRPFDEKKDFVMGLTMLDTSAIRLVLEDNDIGYSLTDESVCSHCGTTNKSDVPVDARFFRPSRADVDAAIRLAKESRRRDKVSGA